MGQKAGEPSSAVVSHMVCSGGHVGVTSGGTMAGGIGITGTGTYGTCGVTGVTGTWLYGTSGVAGT